MTAAELIRRFELTTFAERERLADAAAPTLSPAELRLLMAGLAHGSKAVRLGVIEVLARVDVPEAVSALVAHARAKTGDDRVFALRALARAARPGDAAVGVLAGELASSSDPFVKAHVALLVERLGTTVRNGGPERAARDPLPSVPSAMLVGNLQALDRGLRAQAIADALALGEPGDRLLLRALVETKSDGVRMELVAALEGLECERFAATAEQALDLGNADVVAFVARALVRVAPRLEEATRRGLQPFLERAHRRWLASPLAVAALADALRATDGELPTDLWDTLVDADDEQLAATVDRWLALPAAELAARAAVLMATVHKHPAAWAIVGTALELAVPALRTGARDELRSLCRSAVDDSAELGRASAEHVVALARVFARVAEPGEPLPQPLFNAVERVADPSGPTALCELCLRLSSEEAALRLVALAKDPVPVVAEKARECLGQVASPHIRVERREDGYEVVPAYRDLGGKPLATTPGRLFDASSQEPYALDDRGQPVRVADAAHGACQCCPRPHLLARRGRDGLRCPSSGLGYVRDGSLVVRADQHPLGRCQRCETVLARVRRGSDVVCPECGAGASAVPAIAGVGDDPVVPGEGARELPRPPTADERALIAPPIRHAMVANVFIIADTPTGGWTGSGIVVARAGARVGILTNRHMVEEQRTAAIPPLRGMSVEGEVVPLRVAWRARGGLDLALVEAELASPDAVEVMAIEQQDVLVGSPLFAIGNPLGLAWTYTSGTLSAIRHWQTAEQIPVHLIQTDVTTGPGSSGGGLFHQDGHLVGIISFGKQGEHGDAAHFAISVASVREALAREGVTFAGQRLV